MYTTALLNYCDSGRKMYFKDHLAQYMSIVKVMEQSEKFNYIIKYCDENNIRDKHIQGRVLQVKKPFE